MNGVTIFRPGRRLIVPGLRITQPNQTAFVGILDGVANVVAAYSLRKLSSTYLGAAIRIRRSSDSSEQDIGFDSSGEFDISAFNSFVGGGIGYVKTRYDQSGNTNNVTQTTTAYQPAIELNAVNGKPVLSFDGTDDNMQVPISASGTKSIIALCKPLSGGSADSQMIAASDSAKLEANSGTNYSFYRNSGGARISLATVPATDVLSILSTSGVITIFANGVQKANFTGDAAWSTATLLSIGSSSSGLKPYRGKLEDLIVLSVAISATNHNRIGQNIANRYGVSWSTV